MASRRGALIVFEGCDRSGKSTQSKLLHEFLSNAGVQCKLMNFPNRTTPIGKLIDNYLKMDTKMPDEVIHLLFATNRWELADEIHADLKRGVNLIVDRYAYSGVCYSAAKHLDLTWCKSPDAGLPKPDCVIYMDINERLSEARVNHDEREIYEKMDFQKKVRGKYEELFDDTYWHRIDASHTKDVIHDCIKRITRKTIDNLHENIKLLW